VPALPNVPKCIRIVFTQALQEDANVQDRIYYTYTGTAPTGADLTSFCTTVANNWNAHVSPLQNTNITLTQVAAEDLTSPTSAVAAQAVSHPGTRAGATLTAAVCVVVKHVIARRYRGGHPRTYLWGGSETDIFDVQSWKPAFVSEVQIAWAAFDAANVTGGWPGAGTITPVNVSFFSGFTNVTFPSGRTRPVPSRRAVPLIDAITGVGVNPHIGSQRRRNKQSA